MGKPANLIYGNFQTYTHYPHCYPQENVDYLAFLFTYPVNNKSNHDVIHKNAVSNFTLCIKVRDSYPQHSHFKQILVLND